jgi:DNA-3-methyladenine glycosylase
MDPSVPLVSTRGGLPPGRVLMAEFFARPSDEVAPDLVGKIVWRAGVGGGRLTEVEAYLPQNDPACHAARGRTPRNAAMFGPPGCLYLFVSYGIHVLLNLVCDLESRGSAVLIRSFEPLDDAFQSPSRGPGRVGKALDIHLGLNTLPLGDVSGLHIIDDGVVSEVIRTTRVGISQGGHLPLRFYMAGSAYVTHGVRRTGGSEHEVAGNV